MFGHGCGGVVVNLRIGFTLRRSALWTLACSVLGFLCLNAKWVLLFQSSSKVTDDLMHDPRFQAGT